ncbi:phosphoribulokinase/uridine kinase [Karstenula rhodostoma CBS 690.94]|uniref:Phosphoribulokinase/uridine kinase n=1 Tax=Karstenula rhodostoma CBS 690.94 TaxID=1392251 RepID=A0A9P4UIC7_9PLEO|nr:phosphoribulokinase/uridine kinase [Karstenula rhodostoma CBS 690.94]
MAQNTTTPAAGSLNATILHLATRVEALLARQQASETPSRTLVALAGVPGSGKSTVSAALLAELAARGIADVAVVPMDGFHLTKSQLSSLPNPEEAFARRGAPFTFDAPAFLSLVHSLASTPLPTTPAPDSLIYAPSFDHALQDPVVNGIPISTRTRLIIIEGNYTLLDEEPWRGVAALCAEKWFVDASREVVLERLVGRHLAAGIETDARRAVARVEANDLLNGEVIRARLIRPDVVVEN